MPLLARLSDFVIEFEQDGDFSFGNVYSSVSAFTDEGQAPDLGFGAYYDSRPDRKRWEKASYLE